MFRLGGSFGFIDRSGNQQVFPYLEDAFSFSEGLASGMIAGRWGYVDKSGRPLYPLSTVRELRSEAGVPFSVQEGVTG